MKKEFTFKEARLIKKNISNVINTLTFPSKNMGFKAREARQVYKYLSIHSFFEKTAENEILNKSNNFENNTDFIKLISIMDLYFLNEKHARLCEDITNKIKLETEAMLLNLKSGLNPIRWFFASKPKKENANNAYNYLKKYNEFESIVLASKAIDYFSCLNELNKDRAINHFDEEKEKFEELIKTINISECDNDCLPIFLPLFNLFELNKSRMEKLEKYEEKSQNFFEEGIKFAAANDLMEKLDTISVDELKKIKKGIRVKALKENGFKTIKNLIESDEDEISDIHGISDNGAEVIKDIANEIAIGEKQKLEIKISVNNKNTISDNLVALAYNYIITYFLLRDLKESNEQYTKQIEESISILSEVGKGEYWPFYSFEYRQKIKESYWELDKILKGEYSYRIKSILKRIEKWVLEDNTKYAWINFSRNEELFVGLVKDTWTNINEDDEDFLYDLVYNFWGFEPDWPEYDIEIDDVDDGIFVDNEDLEKAFLIEEKQKENKPHQGSTKKVLEKSIPRCSVTKRISMIQQPRGGYINPRQMDVENKNDLQELYAEENVHSSLIGLAVDYLTRFVLEKDAKKAFAISLLGAMVIGEKQKANITLNKIVGLDDESITNAIKLTGYDCVFRAGAHTYKPIAETNPDNETISNVRIMVERSLEFFRGYGPIVQSGITFKGGYSNVIVSGDADFITEDTLWDFKVSKNEPTNKQTLQLLVYYLMGLRSDPAKFERLKYLGIYNPRLNKVYRYPVSLLTEELIKTVEEKVICY